MDTNTHISRTTRCIVTALGAVAMLAYLLIFLAAARTHAAPLQGTGDDPRIHLITMTADLPHYDPANNDGVAKTVYFSNGVSGLITMTFDISGTHTLTLTAGAAFYEPERVYTSTAQTWTRPITYSVADTHTTQPNVTYTAASTAGLTTLAITYTRDVTAPTSSIAYPSAGQCVSGTQLVISGAASDGVGGSGVQRTQVSTDTAAPWHAATGGAAWAYTWTLPSADGVVYTLSSRAQDNLGAWQQVPPTVSVTVDNVSPTGTVILTPSLPVSQWTNESTLEAQWNGFSDGGGVAGYQYFISDTIAALPLPGAAFTTATGVTEVLPDGEWYFHVAARDAAGNWSAPRYTGPFQVDTLSPTNVAITAPKHISATQFTVSWSADDAVSHTVEYSGTDYTSWQPWLTGVISTEAEFPVPATESDYILRVTAYDHAGNSAQAQTETHVGVWRVYLPLVLRDYSPLANGGFESGLSGWDTDQGPFDGHGSGMPQSVVSFEGSNRALLGETNAQDDSIHVGYGYIAQTFTVEKPRLQLQYRVSTYDIIQGTGQRYFDTFEVSINRPPQQISDAERNAAGCASTALNPAGTLTVSVDGLVFCGGRSGTQEDTGTLWNSGWETVTLDLSGFQGQNITLYLSIWSREYDPPYYNDRAYYNTWAYVDNLSLQE